MGKVKGETMGQRMQRLRLGAGLSQSQLAKKAGIPLGTLKNWEQDLREPSLSKAAALAKAIGCSLDDLAGPVELPKVEEKPPARRGRPRKGE